MQTVRTILSRHRAALALAIAALGAASCEGYERPNRPLPQLKATGLDGADWTRQSFRGRPWVINLWVPG